MFRLSKTCDWNLMLVWRVPLISMLRDNIGFSLCYTRILKLNSEIVTVKVSMMWETLKKKMRYIPTIKNIEYFPSYAFLWVFPRILFFDDTELLAANNESQTLD
jgi:hypothetical protein